MEHIGEALRSFLSGASLAKRVSQWEVILAWPRIVGREVAAHSEAFDLRNGTLWVEVPSSNWRQHILFLKVRILETLAGEYPQVPVRDIRCVIGRGRALARPAETGEKKP
jgi:predicted nucleic acid-binding Zn ribbon protein